MAKKWMEEDSSTTAAVGSGGICEPRPAVMLSTERTRERRAASAQERCWTSPLFIFSEKEAVVMPEFRWNLSGRASYNLYKDKKSKIRKEEILVKPAGRRSVIFSPASRERVKVRPETKERMRMEVTGTRTLPAL